MGFDHAYLKSLAECWRWQPEKMAERSALWPETLTWSWFLDPDRVKQWDRREQLDIVSVATLHAHKVRAPLWEKPARIFQRCKALADAGEASDAARLELYRRLGAELDRFDARVAESAREAVAAALERQRAEREAAEREAAERAELERLSEEERIERLSEEERQQEAQRAAELDAQRQREEAQEAERAQREAELEQRRADGTLTAEDLQNL